MQGDFVNEAAEYDSEAHRAALVKYEDEMRKWQRGQDAEEAEDQILARLLSADDADMAAIKKAIGHDGATRDILRTLARGIAGGTAGAEHLDAAKKRVRIILHNAAEAEMADLLEKAKQRKKDEPVEVGAPEGARSPSVGAGGAGPDEPASTYYGRAAEQVVSHR